MASTHLQSVTAHARPLRLMKMNIFTVQYNMKQAPAYLVYTVVMICVSVGMVWVFDIYAQAP